MKKNDNRPKPQKGSYTLLQSFLFAIQGILYAFKSERNLRIHALVTAYVFYFSQYYSFSRAEKALLVLIIGLVITCELFNTSIEHAVDLESPAYNVLAKIAKDVAAGAVLVSSIASVVVGVLLFWDIAILQQILADILQRWYLWLFLLLVSLVIIFIPQLIRHKQNNKKDGTTE